MVLGIVAQVAEGVAELGQAAAHDAGLRGVEVADGVPRRSTAR